MSNGSMSQEYARMLGDKMEIERLKKALDEALEMNARQQVEVELLRDKLSRKNEALSEIERAAREA